LGFHTKDSSKANPIYKSAQHKINCISSTSEARKHLATLPRIALQSADTEVEKRVITASLENKTINFQ
jgi:hypothetical protein